MVRFNQMHLIKEKICPIIKQPDMCGIHLGEKCYFYQVSSDTIYISSPLPLKNTTADAS